MPDDYQLACRLASVIESIRERLEGALNGDRYEAESIRGALESANRHLILGGLAEFAGPVSAGVASNG